MSIISHHNTDDEELPRRIEASEEGLREPLSDATRAAIKSWIAHTDRLALTELERIWRGLLDGPAPEAGVPLRHKDIKKRSNITTSKGLAAIASGLEPIAKQLISIYGADQALHANVVEKECLWIEARELKPSGAAQYGLIGYNEVDVSDSLTKVGRLLYARLPSSRRWHSPQTLSLAVVGLPLVLLGLVFSTGGWRVLPIWWAIVLFGALMVLVGVGARSLNGKAATQANLIRWPFVKGDVQWSVLHYRRKIDNGVLFQIKAFKTDCPLCGDTVDLELGRHDLTGRIVGECRSNPLEHLFSFDHVSCEGWWLRGPPSHLVSSAERGMAPRGR